MLFRSAQPIILLAALALLAGCAIPRGAGDYIGSGKASYYGSQHHNKPTASGERFNQRAMTAAHRSLPFGSKVRVTNPKNGKSVIVRINDRGPYVRGRIVDLSKAAFEKIANTRAGVIQVRLERID